MESLSALWAAWWDLLLPAPCPGCGRTGASLGPVCGGCAAALAAATPMRARPIPAPSGMPPCHAVGPYQGVLRDLITAYKERGRHGLAAPLADRLAAAVAASADALGSAAQRPLALVPAPATAQAARRRRGDHMLRLARLAGAQLRARGRQAVVVPALRAKPRPDSAGLTAAERAEAAQYALVVRPGVAAVLSAAATPGGAPVRESLSQHVGNRGGVPAKSAVSGAPLVVVVDDVVTTGATIAAACRVLSQAGAHVGAAAVLAATQRRSRRPASRSAVPLGRRSGSVVPDI